jgi:HlyD family secretion protein
MTATQKRLLVWLPLLVLVVAVLAWLLRPQPVPVDLATVASGPLRVTVDEEGRTRVRDVYTVAAPIHGRLRRIQAEVGDPVTAGLTILARIEPADPVLLDFRTRREAESAASAAEAALTLVDAEIERVQAELDLARAELARARALLRTNTVSQAVVDRRASEARSLEAALNEALARRQMRMFELETARARLIQPGDERRLTVAEDGCCVPVTAPVTGVVLAVLEPSETVVDAGRSLIEIGDPEDLEVVVDVLSRDAVRVATEAHASIEGWGGEPLAAIVRRIEPAGFTKVSALGVEEQRVNVVLDPASSPFAGGSGDWRRLGHGYRVEVRITVFEAEDAIRVPLSALFRDGDRWAVFVLANGRARLRHLEIGPRDRTAAMVTTGLEPGERVVLYPSERIDDGSRLVERDGRR